MFRAERDVTVVENTATGRIVSALFLIPQVWSYAAPSAVSVLRQPRLVLGVDELDDDAAG